MSSFSLRLFLVPGKYRLRQYQYEKLSCTQNVYRVNNLFSIKMKTETNNQGKSSVTFFKQSTGIPVPVSHKKVPFRLLFLKNLRIPAGTNSYSGPWTTLSYADDFMAFFSFHLFVHES